ncbi:MAG: MGMT family protein [Thermoplasmata archaeon]|nr:MGMT family protein [Thermoplasmata archaeon]
MTGNGVISVLLRCSDRGVRSIEIRLEDLPRTAEDPFGGVRFVDGLLAGREMERPMLDIEVTPFQRRVYERLCQIPRGQVMTYGELARAVGSSPRAIGQAMHRNPVPLVFPCHRVVASGHLGGYGGPFGAATGIKVHLLEVEARGAARCSAE